MNTDLTLTSKVFAGNSCARQQVTELVLPIVTAKTSRFCKEFCSDNHLKYQCTLDKKWGVQHQCVALCARGNDSIVWMLDDLTNARRLEKYQGRDGTPLINYLSSIAGSFQFRERWKDWRFGRRVRIPDYIKIIDIDAGRIYRWRFDHDSASNIAQRLGRPTADIATIIKRIDCELLKRDNLSKLQSIRVSSLTSVNQDDVEQSQMDICSQQPLPEDLLTHKNLRTAFNKLSWKEQFVLEMTVIDKINARSVLQALVEQQVSLIKNISSDKTTISQIYYFRDKALNNLRKLAGF